MGPTLRLQAASARTYYYIVRPGKVKHTAAGMAILRQKGLKAGAKSSVPASEHRVGEIPLWDKLHKSTCGFFTDMSGILSDLYLRISKEGVIIMVEGVVRQYYALSRRKTHENHHG